MIKPNDTTYIAEQIHWMIDVNEFITDDMEIEWDEIEEICIKIEHMLNLQWWFITQLEFDKRMDWDRYFVEWDLMKATTIEEVNAFTSKYWDDKQPVPNN